MAPSSSLHQSGRSRFVGLYTFFSINGFINFSVLQVLLTFCFPRILRGIWCISVLFIVLAHIVMEVEGGGRCNKYINRRISKKT